MSLYKLLPVTGVGLESLFSIPAAHHRVNGLDQTCRVNVIREANSPAAAFRRHTAETDPVLGLATGLLCVREPLWIEFLTNLSTWPGDIQQLHGTFNLQWMQFKEKYGKNVLNSC